MVWLEEMQGESGLEGKTRNSGIDVFPLSGYWVTKWEHQEGCVRDSGIQGELAGIPVFCVLARDILSHIYTNRNDSIEKNSVQMRRKHQKQSTEGWSKGDGTKDKLVS